jgi:hypothetical protein
MEADPLSITKIELTFNDGKTLCMVTQDRFLRMRDVAKAQSQANDMLVEQAKLLEARIRDLETAYALLDLEHQAWVNEAERTPESTPFQNPLP